MSNYVENPVHFSADCVPTGGQCAINLLQRKCATVAIIPQFLERLSYPRACTLPAAPMRNEQQ